VFNIGGTRVRDVLIHSLRDEAVKKTKVCLSMSANPVIETRSLGMFSPVAIH
jgi:hypothetical protein